MQNLLFLIFYLTSCFFSGKVLDTEMLMLILNSSQYFPYLKGMFKEKDYSTKKKSIKKHKGATLKTKKKNPKQNLPQQKTYHTHTPTTTTPHSGSNQLLGYMPISNIIMELVFWITTSQVTGKMQPKLLSMCY